MHEIILYYKYVPLDEPEKLVTSQRSLCERLGLKGRILIAKEGINGTVEGTKEAIAEYLSLLLSDPRFADTNIKRSTGNGASFPKLKVKLRDEIVSAHLGLDDVKPWEMTAKHLPADELNQWIESGKEFTIVDMRNDYEYKIGRFEGSIDPGMKNFRDLPNIIPKIAHLKDKPLLAVCTGGVRCEKASGYLLKQGFKDVYQLENGIVTYMEKYPNKAFKGKLYVFDDRIAIDFDIEGSHEVVGRCDICESKTEHYVNCQNKECNAHFLVCQSCEERQGVFCGQKCRERLNTSQLAHT
jgi:UPF0176 protein